ncbi:MAG TPA: tRNA (adenosine(37)-N6)-threonylcarbamoyltransferase complex ATPase subunit type 1 TsaE [Pirellulales bacterium]|nr:tRNA (adenosine(37)-N6)-threonylcarbamoyltransferase complex ATPase subunit type 1 TsaE [Pirellulales bacterium]
MKPDFIFEARDEADTAALGAALAAALPRRAVVALNGTLGAGKTRLAQAIAAGLGIDPREVVSPTFVLVQEHHGRTDLFHFDAYRIRDEAEFWELGSEEYFAGPGVSLVEWAERVPGCLPVERLEITIHVTGTTSRRFVMVAGGDEFDDVVARLAAWDRQRGRGAAEETFPRGAWDRETA